MGFYAPAQIVRDVREHGVEVRTADINHSDWDTTLESGAAAGVDGRPAVRLGLRQIDGLSKVEVEKIVAARNQRTPALFTDFHDLRQCAGIHLAMLERLAAADAMRSLGLDRRQALWAVKGFVSAAPLPLFAWSKARETGPDPRVALPVMPLSEHVVCDYQTQRLSLKAHPMSFLRSRLAADGVSACADLRQLDDGTRVAVAGVVLVRQRPGSAKGVVFMTIEDETGIANVVVWSKTLERYRRAVMGARLMLIRGRIQRQHRDIIHVVSSVIEDRSDLLTLLMEDLDQPMPMESATPDEPHHPGSSSARQSRLKQQGGMRRHPRNERIMPRSRDFH